MRQNRVRGKTIHIFKVSCHMDSTSPGQSDVIEFSGHKLDGESVLTSQSRPNDTIPTTWDDLEDVDQPTKQLSTLQVPEQPRGSIV